MTSPDPLALHESVPAQLDELTLERGRPLIVTDCDEVLVAFLKGLERYLEANDLWIDLQSFALSGNIKHRGTNEPVPPKEMPALLERFFDTETHRLEAVEGAAEALSGLSKRAQVVVLSNLPLTQRRARIDNLAAQGLDYPVIANQGLKGGPVRRLAELVEAPVFFLDDLPPNISSVAEAHEPSYRIHFIADERLAKLLGPAKDSHFHTTDWNKAKAFIEEKLAAEGF
ncbi:hypothetical protein FHS78_000304 [Parvibaculum indicum]|uniref:hypothetical protein n=1 Tax=Parvibaculum indicum TaxID=562969 RepID=UPI0014231DA6|nr:hypothetical protein [Parvibaculum indicum]NIJ40049.1 hypothetical protein [Parvibaculum indicum]